MKSDRLWRVLLAVGCTYEVVALWTRTPTITAIVHRAKRHPIGRIAVWAAAGGAVWHFFVEGEQT